MPFVVSQILPRASEEGPHVNPRHPLPSAVVDGLGSSSPCGGHSLRGADLWRGCWSFYRAARFVSDLPSPDPLLTSFPDTHQASQLFWASGHPRSRTAHRFRPVIPYHGNTLGSKCWNLQLRSLFVPFSGTQWSGEAPYVSKRVAAVLDKKGNLRGWRARQCTAQQGSGIDVLRTKIIADTLQPYTEQ